MTAIPRQLDMASLTMALIAKNRCHIKKPNRTARRLRSKSDNAGLNIGRGISFASELPDSADAHYAGKGVKRDEPDRPIFWYKPEGSEKYRVIYADLSVKDADAAPEIAGAVDWPIRRTNRSRSKSNSETRRTSTFRRRKTHSCWRTS